MRTDRATQQGTRTPWYEAAFEVDYLKRYAHRSDRAAAAEVAFLVRVLGLPRGSALLDLCCGAGRHSRALSAKGFRVVSLDLSLDLLREGKRKARRPFFVRADVRRVPFPAESFDGVVNLFTSFGYFTTQKENLAVLRGVSRILRPGGVLVLDFLNLQPTLEGLVPRSERVVGGARLTERRRYDRRSGRLEKRIRIEERGRPVRELKESVRAYAPQELKRMLVLAGLKVQGSYGDLRGAAFNKARSPRCVWVARKDE